MALKIKEIEKAYREATVGSCEPNEIFVSLGTLKRWGVPNRMLNKLKGGKVLPVDVLFPYLPRTRGWT